MLAHQVIRALEDQLEEEGRHTSEPLRPENLLENGPRAPKTAGNP